jgi:hypothetical protein
MKDMRIYGAVIAAMILTASCGVESYLYLEPVSNVTASFNSSAVVRLPSSSDVITIDFTINKTPSITISNQTKTLGSDYEIYYRIYLSNKSINPASTKGNRYEVNPTLEADWTAFEPYTVEANNRASSFASLVASRKYYSVEMESGRLKRSNGNGAFDPKPSNRFFICDDDLKNRDYLTDNLNADVVGMNSETPTDAYVSMYIVMRAFDPQTLSPIYSAPTFINVFKLPSDVPVVLVKDVGITGYTPTATPPAALRLTAIITPDNATDTSLNWTLGNNTDFGIREVDTTGDIIIVYSKTPSAKTVTVSVRTNDGGHTSSIDIDLEGVAIQTVDLNLTQQTLSVDSQETLIATVSPSDAKKPDINWSSSNPSVATVSPDPVDRTKAVVTAISSGNAIITAITEDGTEIVKTCEITVN